MSLIEKNKCSNRNCMIKDSKTNSFVVDSSAPPNSECCREENKSIGQKSNRGLWCAKGSCDTKTGLCSKPAELKCLNNIRENYDSADTNNMYKYISISVLVLTMIIGAIFIWRGSYN